jgi:hypothetical protein
MPNLARIHKHAFTASNGRPYRQSAMRRRHSAHRIWSALGILCHESGCRELTAFGSTRTFSFDERQMAMEFAKNAHHWVMADDSCVARLGDAGFRFENSPCSEFARPGAQ